MTDRETFPSLRDEVGEDPARWLDRDLLARQTTRVTYTTDDLGRTHAQIKPDTATSTDGEKVHQRIAGIRSLPLLRAWRAVERKLGRGDDGGPRDRVMDWLAEREDELDAMRDRPERERYLPEGPIPSTESSATWADRDGGERSTTYRRNRPTFGSGEA